MALRRLDGNSSGFEFLPPKVTQWMELSAKFSSRRILWSSATAGSIILLMMLAFLVQYIHLSILQSRWRAIEPRATEIDGMQQNIRKFRPWFDNSARTLTILKRITEAFPEDGAVSMKTLEIKDLSDISWFRAWPMTTRRCLKVLDKMRDVTQVSDVKSPTSPWQITAAIHLRLSLVGRSHS